MDNSMLEICKHCGFTYGSHCSISYYSNYYKMFIPRDYCPGHEGGIDWDEGPGTTFLPTGIYKEDKEGTSDN